MRFTPPRLSSPCSSSPSRHPLCGTPAHSFPFLCQLPPSRARLLPWRVHRASWTVHWSSTHARRHTHTHKPASPHRHTNTTRKDKQRLREPYRVWHARRDSRALPPLLFQPLRVVWAARFFFFLLQFTNCTPRRAIATTASGSATCISPPFVSFSRLLFRPLRAHCVVEAAARAPVTSLGVCAFSFVFRRTAFILGFLFCSWLPLLSGC